LSACFVREFSVNHHDRTNSMNLRKCVAVASLASAALMATAPAFAQDKSAGSGPNPFTDCGIGAALFPETKWAAVTSNVIWDIGITAVVSATASPQTCSGKKVTAALFIRDTYDKLAEETAAGNGEHLSVAMAMFGCAAAAQQATALQVRSAMGTAVAAPGYVDKKPLDKAADFYAILDKAAGTSCTA
jgi:Protein of unknown function (DUF3015)